MRRIADPFALGTASLPPLAQWGMARVSLVAATILLPVLVAAALHTCNDWKTEKIDHRLFIEIGPLF
jgi:hypothetical protein